MEIVFFVALPEDAAGVASSDDVPGDWAAEPIEASSPAALLELGAAAGLAEGPCVRQLRDATCRSFPVWALTKTLCARLEAASDEDLEDIAKAWQPGPGVDLYERASCLEDLRAALTKRSSGERLFALLEERAF